MKSDLEFISAIFEIYNIPKVSKEKLESTNFENIGYIHDWRKYVSDIFKEEWKNLTYREKVIIYCQSEKQADEEQWD